MDNERPKEDCAASESGLPGTAALLFLSLVGLILLFAPFVASEFEGHRDAAIQLLVRALPAGALVGIAAAMAAGRSGQGNASGWGKNLFWLFAAVGYFIASQGTPRLLGVFYGVGAGGCLGLSAVAAFRRRRQRG